MLAIIFWCVIGIGLFRAAAKDTSSPIMAAACIAGVVALCVYGTLHMPG